MRAVCSGTRGRGCCSWSDMAKPPEITAPTPLSTFRLTHSPTVSGHIWDGHYIVTNAKRWSALPSDVRDVISRNFSASALKQREDVARQNTELEEQMKKEGL